MKKIVFVSAMTDSNAIMRDERTYEQAYKTMYPYKPYGEDVED